MYESNGILRGGPGFASVGRVLRSTPQQLLTKRHHAYLNGTTQGIASGVGSFSEAGEPARRTGARELTLAEKLRAALDEVSTE